MNKVNFTLRGLVKLVPTEVNECREKGRITLRFGNDFGKFS